MFPRTDSVVHRTFLDALIGGYLVMTLGGFYMTFTHKPFPIIPLLAGFSYASIAPYQGDDEFNVKLAVVGYDAAGRSTLVPIDQYFVGDFGELNARENFDLVFERISPVMALAYVPFLTQILEHERQQGRPYARLLLYNEVWQKSSRGFYARHAEAGREFLTSVR